MTGDARTKANPCIESTYDDRSCMTCYISEYADRSFEHPIYRMRIAIDSRLHTPQRNILSVSSQSNLTRHIPVLGPAYDARSSFLISHVQPGLSTYAQLARREGRISLCQDRDNSSAGAPPNSGNNNVQDKPMLSSLDAYFELIQHVQMPEERQLILAIAQQLRQTMQHYGFTRLELARQIGVDVEVILSVENGHGDSETAKDILRRCEELKCHNNRWVNNS